MHWSALTVGQIWIAQTRVRRIIYAGAGWRGMVCYCAGGDTNRFCQRRTFIRWIRDTRAKR